MKFFLLLILLSIFACTSEVELLGEGKPEAEQITCLNGELYSSQGKVYSGKLRMHIYENETEKIDSTYAFELETGEVLAVANEDHVKDLPINAEINIVGELGYKNKDNSDELRIIKASDKSSYTGGECSSKSYKALNPKADKQERDQDIGLYYMAFQNSPHQFKQEDIERDAARVQSLYNKFSLGKRKFKVRAYRVEIPYENIEACNNCQNVAIELAVDFQKENNIINTKFIVSVPFAIYWNGVSYSGFAGIGSRHALTSQGRIKTIIHELGHTLGLGHANKNGLEYADISSLMSSTGPENGFNSLGLMYLGVHSEDATHRITKTQKVYFTSVDLPESEVKENQTQIAILDSGSETYYISKKNENSLRGRPEALYIHQMSGTATDLIKIMSPGEKYKLPRGEALIDYLSFGNGIATADLYTNAKDSPPMNKVIEQPTKSNVFCKYQDWKNGSAISSVQELAYQQIASRDLAGQESLVACAHGESGIKKVLTFVRQKIQCVDSGDTKSVNINLVSQTTVQNEISNSCSPDTSTSITPVKPVTKPDCDYKHWPRGQLPYVEKTLAYNEEVNRHLRGRKTTTSCNGGEETTYFYDFQRIKCVDDNLGGVKLISVFKTPKTFVSNTCL